jgi:hypothetical protein
MMRGIAYEHFREKGMNHTESGKGIHFISEISIPSKAVVVDLEGNRIAMIRSTDANPQLHGLLLSDSLIEDLSECNFRAYPELRILRIQKNLISNVKPSAKCITSLLLIYRAIGFPFSKISSR